MSSLSGRAFIRQRAPGESTMQAVAAPKQRYSHLMGKSMNKFNTRSLGVRNLGIIPGMTNSKCAVSIKSRDGDSLELQSALFLEP